MEEWSIQQLARLAGVTSRTLRHYGDVGLLEPSRVGANGYRYYDARALARLQRILLLRQLGVGIAAIRESLAGADDEEALGHHLRWLREERDRIDRQIRAVEHTVTATREDGVMDADAAFDGFDQRRYEAEVTERWGVEAWRSGQAWWRGLGEEGRAAFQQEHVDLVAGYADARAAGLPVDGAEVQALVARHWRWIAASWQREPEVEAFVGLADLYVADERFAAAYGGPEAAEYAADAMRAFAAGRA
ncbi:MerR family transcriptional regulator [Agrococcus sp. SGAir0287]|uniref:MerR family transcriptional regulator n=1 Tax=Agrococcus sp. SGAir0287 TaxID=2070347 RepID=UPI001586E611|nr:MerR family transcriptional regulator [Agrococcus sp. SGAir0287]